MNFLNPFALIGLAAASIPIILHLLNLKKQKVIEFSSIRFLKELKKSKIRNVKLKQIILLILRTLIVIFVVLSLSDPVIPGQFGLFSGTTKTGNVILIDNSPSNDINDGNGNRLNRGKRIAAQMLSSLKNGDEASVLPMVGAAAEATLSRDRSVMDDDLAHIGAASYKSGLGQSLINAGNILSTSNNTSRNLYIISDFQKNIIDDIRDYKPDPSVEKIILIPGSEGDGQLSNISLDTFTCKSRLLQPNSSLEFSVNLKNNGTANVKGVMIGLYLNKERVAQAAVNLSPGESQSLDLKAAIRNRGPLIAEAKIENDKTEFDNNRFISLIVPKKPNILVVGEEQTSLFVNSLMQTKFRDDLLFTVDRASARSLGSYDLHSFDAVVITSLPDKDEERLLSYVKQGGGLFLFADPYSSDEKAARFLSKFDLAYSGAAALPESRQITGIDRLHPVIEGIYESSDPGNSKRIAESPAINKYARIGGAYPVIWLNDSPLLGEKTVDKGKLLFSALPANTEWSNFPITGLFPAIVTRGLTYLASEAAEQLSTDGQSALNIKVPEKYQASGNYKITPAEGKADLFVAAADMPTGSYVNIESGLPKGAYTVFNSAGEPVAGFAVNHEVSESSLDFFTAAQVEKILKEKMKFKGDVEIAGSSPDTAKLLRATVNTELWLPFLYFALLCIIAEMLVQKNFRNDEAAV